MRGFFIFLVVQDAAPWLLIRWPMRRLEMRLRCRRLGADDARP